MSDKHAEGDEKKPSHWTPVLVTVAVLAVIAFVLPMAGEGIGAFLEKRKARFHP